MLRRSALVECVSVLHGTCLQSVDIFFIRQYVQPGLSKNPKKKSSPINLGPKISTLFDALDEREIARFQMREHSWPCRFHIALHMIIL
jgi:hypothetical protein